MGNGRDTTGKFMKSDLGLREVSLTAEVRETRRRLCRRSNDRSEDQEMCAFWSLVGVEL